MTARERQLTESCPHCGVHAGERCVAVGTTITVAGPHFIAPNPLTAVNLACHCWINCPDDCPCQHHKEFEKWMDSIQPNRHEMANDVAEAARIVGLSALSDSGLVVELAQRLIRHAERLRKDPPCACDPTTGKRCLSHTSIGAIA